MDVMLVTVGSMGDLLPFLAIGAELMARGYRVSLATNTEFEPHVRRMGLGFEPIFAMRDFELPPQDISAWDPHLTWAIGWEHCLVPVMRRTYELIQKKRPDGLRLVVAHWQAFGARLAQERLDVPLCTCYLAPHPLNSSGVGGETLAPELGLPDDGFFGPALNAYRREIGLPAVDNICSHWMHSPQQGIALFPEWFAMPHRHWPPQVKVTGFVLYDEAVISMSNEPLRRFLTAGGPPIVFTPGTAVSQAGKFFRESLRACAELGRRAIFLTPHREQLPANLPQWVLHLDYIPLNRLLRHAAAVVYHGGIGTCAQAIRAGTRHLITSIASDQFDNARRVHALSLGLNIPMREYCAQRAADSLAHLLRSSKIAAACTQWSRDFDSQKVIVEVCDTLEGMLIHDLTEKSHCLV